MFEVAMNITANHSTLTAGVLSVISSCFALAIAALFIITVYYYEQYVSFTYVLYVNTTIQPTVAIFIGSLGFLAFAFGTSAGVLSLKKIEWAMCLFGASFLLTFGFLTIVDFVVIGLPVLGTIIPDYPNMHPVRFSISPLVFSVVISLVIVPSAVSLILIVKDKTKFAAKNDHLNQNFS